MEHVVLADKKLSSPEFREAESDNGYVKPKEAGTVPLKDDETACLPIATVSRHDRSECL